MDELGYETRHGSNHQTVKKRIELYGIDTSHFAYQSPIKRSEDNVFCKNSTASQATLRRWYKIKFNDSRCEICGQSKMWNNKDLTMVLDHINGDKHDNRIENLRWICTNCDSQLPTFAGRNSTR